MSKSTAFPAGITAPGFLRGAAVRSEFVHHLSLAVVITVYEAAIPCSAPVTLPVRPLLFSADMLISQAFLEIFAFWPPLYRDLQGRWDGVPW